MPSVCLWVLDFVRDTERETNRDRESQPTHLCHYQTVSGEGSFVPFSRKVCSIRPFLQDSLDGLQPLSLPNSAATGVSALRVTVYTRAYMCFIVLALERFQHKAVFLRISLALSVS